jgi:hypothetical protein
MYVYSLIALALGCLLVIIWVEGPKHAKKLRIFEVPAVSPNLDYALSPSPGPPYKIAVCTNVQNEAPYIAEWMAYNRMIGIDHFFIYDNNSTDSLEAAIAPFQDRGWVTHVKPTYSTMGTRFWEYQKDCSVRNELALSSQWLAVFDVDEFLILPGEISTQLGGLLSILQRYKEGLNCTGLVLDRYEFGAGPHQHPPETGLVIENYIERSVKSPFMKRDGDWPKLIGMPKYHVFDGVHWYDEERSNGTSCLPDGQPPLRGERTKVFEPLRFHHYLARSKSECMEKLERRRYDNREHNWRVAIGESLCESLTRGGSGYDNSNFVDDLTLATSDWPNLIRLFTKALHQDN